MREEMRTPKVYVIILNWNNYTDTRTCLYSLMECKHSNRSIVLVDNASKDGSGFLLRDEFPELQFIFNSKNLGFARGCNVGIRAALANEDCDYVLLLNNDAEVTQNFLEKAVEVAESHPRIGLVGGKILRSPECKKIWYAGGRVDVWRGQGIARGWGELDQGQYDKVEEVKFVTGALMLIKREVLEKVGLLPEEYFFGVEEFDYSVSVHRAGYLLYYVPEFIAYHKGDGSHYNYDNKYIYNYYRQKFIFMEKYLPKGCFPFWKIIFQVYTKFFFKRLRTRNILKHHSDRKDKLIGALDDLRIVMQEALRDHGKDVLTEETMQKFAKRFEFLKEQSRSVSR